MSILSNIFKPRKRFNIRKGTLGLEEFDYFISNNFSSISKENYNKALKLYYDHKDNEMLSFLKSLDRG